MGNDDSRQNDTGMMNEDYDRDSDANMTDTTDTDTDDSVL